MNLVVLECRIQSLPFHIRYWPLVMLDNLVVGKDSLVAGKDSLVVEMDSFDFHPGCHIGFHYILEDMKLNLDLHLEN